MSLASAAAALDDLTREFAYCTGRYSAELEHAWLMRDPAADDREARRDSFVALLEAVSSEDSAPSVLNHRISAKVAHAALLRRASFAEESDSRDHARALAASLVRSCDGFLLRG